MGEAEDSQAEADHISGGREADRGSAKSTVGEGEEREEFVIRSAGSNALLFHTQFHFFRCGPS
jgi:hypothetical protein